MSGKACVCAQGGVNPNTHRGHVCNSKMNGDTLNPKHPPTNGLLRTTLWLIIEHFSSLTKRRNVTKLSDHEIRLVCDPVAAGEEGLVNLTRMLWLGERQRETDREAGEWGPSGCGRGGALLISPGCCGWKDPLCAQAAAYVIISLSGLQAACNSLLVNKKSERCNNCFCLASM